MSTLKIAHLTSVHYRYDTRIFLKECVSLVNEGYRVDLLIADGLGDETLKNIYFHDVGASTGRLRRMAFAPRRLYKKALMLNADIYHLHDPELIPIGLKLKKNGKKVIFDSHEDVPKQLYKREYLPKPINFLISKMFLYFERWACRKFDAVIAATPSIQKKFLSINSNTVNINNFPLLRELNAEIPWSRKSKEICYLGVISKFRGIQEICEAMQIVKSDIRLNLCGNFSEPSLENKIKSLRGWKRVNYLGFLSRESVRDILKRSLAGLVIFHPAPNHIDAQPNKIFEYMSAGIPVIASDFLLWREIIAYNDCGLLVNPLNSEEIAQAIDKLITNPKEAQRLGKNGRLAIEKHFNWQIEEKKLINLYHNLLMS
jgi:glycosyltransferase involved in cell wall biosynthesis